VRSIDADILTVIETHLPADKHIQCEGYTWFGHNRNEMHRRAPKPSGGVGILVKKWVVETYEISIVDKSYDGI
jgi:hypothetical protein